MLRKTKVRKAESIFLKEEVAIQFSKNNLGILYIADIDTLFAVESITYPYDDHPYFEIMGYYIDNFRDQDFTNALSNTIKNLILKETRKYTFSSNVKWIYEDKLDVDYEQ